ncbi:hypothetical protein M9458_027727, partial [Cirrhinus mrigala]
MIAAAAASFIFTESIIMLRSNSERDALRLNQRICRVTYIRELCSMRAIKR